MRTASLPGSGSVPSTPYVLVWFGKWEAGADARAQAGSVACSESTEDPGITFVLSSYDPRFRSCLPVTLLVPRKGKQHLLFALATNAMYVSRALAPSSSLTPPGYAGSTGASSSRPSCPGFCSTSVETRTARCTLSGARRSGSASCRPCSSCAPLCSTDRKVLADRDWQQILAIQDVGAVEVSEGEHVRLEGR